MDRPKRVSIDERKDCFEKQTVLGSRFATLDDAVVNQISQFVWLRDAYHTYTIPNYTVFVIFFGVQVFSPAELVAKIP